MGFQDDGAAIGNPTFGVQPLSLRKPKVEQEKYDDLREKRQHGCGGLENKSQGEDFYQGKTCKIGSI
jgi:hypothetical protein